MAFPKAKQIKHSHASVTKTHPFSGKEVFSCGTVAASILVAPFWSLQPPLPPALGAPFAGLSPFQGNPGTANVGEMGATCLFPVGSLASLLPNNRAELSKTRHFSRRWHYFLASPAVNPWSLRGFADLVLPSQAVATTLI